MNRPFVTALRDRLRYGAVALLWAGAACGPDAGHGPGEPSDGAPLGLGEAPILVVGERQGEPAHELYDVRAPFLLPEGGVAVPLARGGTVRLFDSAGGFVSELGGEGEGPGEFMGLSTAWARGDTIEAHDSRLRRVTRFVPGEPPVVIPLDPVPSAEVAVPGAFHGGWVLYGVEEVQPTGRDRLAVHRYALDGTHLGEVAEVDGFRRHSFPGGAGPDPISPRPLIRGRDGRVLVAETLTPQIRGFSLATGEEERLTWTPEDRLPREEAVRTLRNTLSAVDAPEGDHDRAHGALDALSGSEEVPVFWDVLVDGAEHLWIRGYDPRLHSLYTGGLQGPGPGGEWMVLDRHGKRVTTLALPADLEPVAIDGDRLIGVRRDELDVESVRVYPILRAGGS